MRQILFLFIVIALFYSTALYAAGISQNGSGGIFVNGVAVSEEKEFVLLALSGDQGNINANTVVLLRDDTDASINNNLTFNNGTNRATLKSGKTYLLSAFTRHFGNPSNTAANYRWFDVTNTTFFGAGNQVASLNSLTNDGAQVIASAIVAPSTNIDVEFRCITVSAANQGLRADSTHAIIQQLN